MTRCKRVKYERFQPEVCEPCNKYCYATYHLAVNAVLRRLKRNGAVSLRIYQCEHRKKITWHLTKRLKRL